MDLTETIAPKTDQQNFDMYLTGPRTVTISAVTKGTTEQPVSIELVEHPGQPWRPNKTMRRLLVLAWGTESSAYVGRRLTLFGNPDVIYGGKAVGGIEVAAMSNLDKPLTVALTATRGRRKTFTVHPLPEASDWLHELSLANGDLDAITSLGKAARAANAGENIITAIMSEYQRVQAEGAGQ